MPSRKGALKGLARYPDYDGKLFRRAPFLDATQRIYWAPGQSAVSSLDHGGTNGDGYFAPDDWPKVGAPVVEPRVVRWHYFGDVAPFNAWKLTGQAVKSQIESTYPNITVTLISSYPAELRMIAPTAVDVQDQKFIGADAMMLLFSDNPFNPYHNQGTATTTALYNTHKDNLAAAIPQFPRYRCTGYVVDFRGRLVAQHFPQSLANTLFAGELAFWSGPVAGDFAALGYTFGGSVSDANIGGDATTYVQLIEDAFKLKG